MKVFSLAFLKRIEMKRLNPLLFLILLLVPVQAAASDPTPFVILFIGVPFVVSILVLVICLFARRLGAILAGLWLLAHIPFLAWIIDARFLRGAGGWLAASFLISGAGLLLALLRQKNSDGVELSISEEKRRRAP
jgi:hypothetical protein